jgi:hypothetical protein
LKIRLRSGCTLKSSGISVSLAPISHNFSTGTQVFLITLNFYGSRVCSQSLSMPVFRIKSLLQLNSVIFFQFFVVLDHLFIDSLACCKPLGYEFLWIEFL